MKKYKMFIQLLAIFYVISGMLSVADAHVHEPTEITGSLANLYLHQDSVQLDLFVSIEGFELITGLELPREYINDYNKHRHAHSKHTCCDHSTHEHNSHHHDSHGHKHERCCFSELLNNILIRSKDNLSRIESFLNQNIRISAEDIILNGTVSRIETCDPKYIVIHLDYPSKELASAESLKFLYNYEPARKDFDQLCLAVYDKRRKESSVQVIHLHGHRKTAHWTANSLTSTSHLFESTTSLNANILSVFLGLIAIHLFNILISKRNKNYVDN